VVPTDGPSAESAPFSKCETVTRADGSQCQLCYAASGMLVSSTCSPDPTPDAVGMSDVAPICKSVPTGDTTCLLCVTAQGMMTMDCLKCDAPVKTSATGDYCRTCAWSAVSGSCLQCYSSDGKSTFDDCDALHAGTPADAGVMM